MVSIRTMIQPFWIVWVVIALVSWPSLSAHGESASSQQVTAGQSVTMQVDVSAATPGQSLLIRLGGWRQQWPAQWHLYKAVDHVGHEGQVVEDKQTAVGKVVHPQDQGYATIFKLKQWPRTDRPLSVWYLAKGAPMCLKNAEGKEIHWNWQSPDHYQWMSFGTYRDEDLGGGLEIMARKSDHPERVAIEAVVLTDGDNAPSSGADIPQAGRFTWLTNASSVGTHHFAAVVEQDGKIVHKDRITVDVLPSHATPATEQGDLHEIGTITPLRLPQLNLTLVNDDPAVRLLPTTPPNAPAMLQGHILVPMGKINGEFAGLALQSSRTEAAKAYPKDVTVPVDQSAEALVFYHAEMGNLSVGQEVFAYEVQWADGKTLRLPVVEGVQIGGTLTPPHVESARTIYVGFNGQITTQAFAYVAALPKARRKMKIRAIHLLGRNGKSMPLVLGIGLVHGYQPPAAMAARPASTTQAASAQVTVDFGQRPGKIDRDLFGTNEQTFSARYAPAGDAEYQRIMQEIGPSMVRVHMSGLTPRVFPTPDSQGELHLMDGLGRIFANPQRKGEKVMLCFGSLPKWVDTTDAHLRERFADQCAVLARYLLDDLKVPITHWEPFNEPYGRGINDGGGRWILYNEIARRLHAIDPSAKVGGPALAWPDMGILESFLKACADQVDFISWHLYPTGSIQTPIDALLGRTGEFGRRSKMIRALTARYIPDRPVEQALTEYNINYDWRPTDPRQATYLGSCWMASVLIHLADADMNMAQTWHSKGGGTFGMVSASNEIRPDAVLLRLLNHHFGDGDRALAVSSRPDVEALAAIKGDQVAVLLVNKAPHKVRVELDCLNAGWPEAGPMEHPVTSWTIAKETDPVRIERIKIELNSQGRFITDMPAHGVRVLQYQASSLQGVIP